MRTHVSEDKSFTVSAKSKRYSIVGNCCANGLHVATSFRAYQKKKKKKKNVGRDWKEANETRGLIIHDSMRKSNSVIVNYNYTFFLHLGLSLYDFDTYEINSLMVCLNSFLFLK